MPNPRETLIQQLKDSRQRLIVWVARTPAGKCIYPNWTVKEYIDHVSGWDDAIVEALTAHANNEPIPLSAARGIDVYNAQTVSTRETLDLAHSLREFHSGHKRVIDVLQNLPDEKFNQPLTFPWGGSGTVEDFIQVFVEHDDEHSAHLEAWLKNPNATVEEH
jgi:hypothetical protein